ncbi:MAG: aldehyde dehydrogenase family protein [Sphaerochaetaceae bacterium]|nr:aldehyde dehydrogenase family protein [Sphaerochaetaceae bacterium]
MIEENKKDEAKAYVATLIERARKAQSSIEFASQKEVDALAEAICWNALQPEFARELAELAVQESRMGDVESKYAKMMTKSRGGWFDMKGQKSVGILEEDHVNNLVCIAKPVGVIGALVPCTNCEATPVLKAAWTLKTRNAVIMAPHPRTQKTNEKVVNMMRGVIESYGYNPDLIINMSKVSLENSQQLMAQCDLILATGGPGMVAAAYSSGTPAYGVGAGNAVTIVDDTQDMKVVAEKIRRSKTFDQATSCSSENGAVVESKVYDEFIKAMEAEGGYLLNSEEKEKLQKAMWPDGHTLNREVVAQSADKIAKVADIDLPEGKKFFMVEEVGVGERFPFSGEKLSVVITLYKWDSFADAVDLVNRITQFSGAGHSCGIHTANRERAIELASKVRVSRVMVNQPQSLSNSGAWTNGMPVTLTLGCGTWGGNISSENVTWKHLINKTWVSFPIESKQPKDEDLFSREVRERR